MIVERNNWHTIASILLLTTLLVGAIAACSRGDDDGNGTAGEVSVDMQVEPDPPTMGPAAVTFTLTDNSGQPVTGATLEIEGNMTHAGMEPVFSEITETEDGVYVTDEFSFTMGGDWIITVSGELANGETIQETYDLSGVEG